MLKIGYLGPEGTYSSYAARLYDKENLKIPFNPFFSASLIE